MKMTEKDIELFKGLSSTGTGKALLDYLDRMLASVNDARTWGPNDTKETIQKVTQVIEKNLIDKIRLRNAEKNIEKNPFL